MKRSMGGGSVRGPVAVGRQRRTIRFVQLLLVLVSGALMMFAGYSFGRISGFEDGRRAGEIDAPRDPSLAQPLVLVALGTLAIGAAGMLQDGRSVRLPTPARLEELTGRAEAVAIEKAEEIAHEQASAEVEEERSGEERSGEQRSGEQRSGEQRGARESDAEERV